MALLRRLSSRFIPALALLLAAAQSPGAAELHLYEQEIKAGMIYNFLKYTDWPAGDSALVICTLGSGPLGGYLGSMKGRTVNSRKIDLRAISGAGDAGACQLVVMGASEKSAWQRLAPALSGKGVLTVGDYAGFASEGGMIEFGHKDNRINVVLNVDALHASRLTVQDRLLRLVTVVHGGGP
jgi:hypothetical protein